MHNLNHELTSLFKAVEKQTFGMDTWLENESDYPLNYLKTVTHDVPKKNNDIDNRKLCISRLAVAPFLFYRFNNETRLWDITNEPFSSFDAIEVWQEDRPYPKVALVRKWLETL